MKKLLLALLCVPALWANISFWKIQNVQSWDTLNIRQQADHTSKKVGAIPSNEQCIINYGCGKDISIEVMMHMRESEVKAFLEQAQDGWCYIEYAGTKGWVNQKYLAESQAQCQ